MARHRCVRVPHPEYSRDLAIADFDMFGHLKQELSGRTLEGEQNVLETVTEILNGLPKDEVRDALLHWRKRCQSLPSQTREFYPN
jgi:hypothetical protein